MSSIPLVEGENSTPHSGDERRFEMNEVIVHAIVSGGFLVKNASYEGEIYYPQHPGAGFKPTIPGFETHRLHYLDWDDPLVKETLQGLAGPLDPKTATLTEMNARAAELGLPEYLARAVTCACRYLR